MVLVINDNLYGLIFALSSMCRLSFSLCQDHLLIKTKLACLHWLESRSRLEDHLLIMAKLVSMCWSQGALLDLHLLESRLREESYVLIKAKCVLIDTQVQVKICRRVLLPSWCMGEQHVNLHQAKRNQERWCVLRR